MQFQYNTKLTCFKKTSKHQKNIKTSKIQNIKSCCFNIFQLLIDHLKRVLGFGSRHGTGLKKIQLPRGVQLHSVMEVTLSDHFFCLFRFVTMCFYRDFCSFLNWWKNQIVYENRLKIMKNIMRSWHCLCLSFHFLMCKPMPRDFFESETVDSFTMQLGICWHRMTSSRDVIWRLQIWHRRVLKWRGTPKARHPSKTSVWLRFFDRPRTFKTIWAIDSM